MKSRSGVDLLVLLRLFAPPAPGLGGGFGGGLGGDARGDGAAVARDAREVARVADAGLSQDAVAEPVARRPARRHVGIVSTPPSSDAGLGAGAGARDGRGIGHGGGRGDVGDVARRGVAGEISRGRLGGRRPGVVRRDAGGTRGTARGCLRGRRTVADDPGAEASAPAPAPNASAPTPCAVGAPSVTAVDPADAPADASSANARI